MDDWQEAALSNRHLHNRRGKNVGGKAGKNATFNVHRAFGSYELKCPSANKLADTDQPAHLEIYCLNENQDALYAEINMPGILSAVVVLAGSRKTMNTILRQLSADLVDKPQEQPQQDEESAGERTTGDEDDTETDLESQRAQYFEKNSFRSPKFWLRWQGELLNEPRTSDQTTKDLITDTGYLVFSGNLCDRFDGTISCERLGWNNVKMKGFKSSTRSARNFNMIWHPI